MTFNVSSSKLYQQLQAVARVIAPKNSLQVLEDVLFDLKGNTLTLTASDGETTIRTSLEVENANGEGRVAFAAKLMLETLKEFSEQPLTFAINDDNFALNINSMNGVYSFVGQNGNEYPEMQVESEQNKRFEIPSDKLLDAVSKTLFCTADDELRPVMNGIYFDLKPEGLTMVATDAHRLIRYTLHEVASAEPLCFILPKKPAVVLRGVLGKDSENVVITFGERNVTFEFGTTRVVCRQIEGRYPNYNAVIPQNNTNLVTVNRQDIVNACKRVAVYASSGTALIKLALSANQIKISAQDIDFSTSAEEVIPCSYDGPSFAIGFKAPFLVEILNSVETDEVLIKLADPSRAGLVLPVTEDGNEDLLMLLMPMLLND